MDKMILPTILMSSLSVSSFAELTALDDSVMEQATAQAGITIELSANVSAGKITYTDTDGHPNASGTAGRLNLEDVVLGGSNGGPLDNVKIDIDVDANTGLVVHVGGTNMLAVYSGAEERMDFGLSVGEINVNDKFVLASDVMITGNLGPTDLIISNSGQISLESYFEITSGSLDVDVIGIGIDNLKVGSNNAPIMSGKYADDIVDYQTYILDSLASGELDYLETTYATEIADAQDAALADQASEINAIGDQAVIDNQALITQAGVDAVNSTQGQTAIAQAGNTAVINNAATISGAGDSAVLDNQAVIIDAGNTAVANNQTTIMDAGNTAVLNNQTAIANAGTTAVNNNGAVITAAGDTAVATNSTVITQAGDQAVSDGAGEIQLAGNLAYWASLIANPFQFGLANQERTDAEVQRTTEIRTEAETQTATAIRTDAETTTTNQIRSDAELATTNQIRDDAQLATEASIRNDAQSTTESQIRTDAEVIAETEIREDAESDAETQVQSDAEAVAEASIREEATESMVSDIRKRTKTTVLTQYAQSDSLKGVSGMGFVSLNIGTEDTSYTDRETSQKVYVQDALRIDVNAMNLDISADLSMGSRQGNPGKLGSIAIDDLDMSGSSITIFGLQ